MPYIKDIDRTRIDRGELPVTAGELNYKIFEWIKYECSFSDPEQYRIIKKFVNDFLGQKPNYQKYNDMTGCLVRCYKELKRRYNIDARFLLEIMEEYDEEIEIYEDEKILENGDV